jgi:aspartyl-tRNA(Asn)/glutamyl-tRNA(Gln) amidotransferase subunit A
MRLYPGPAETIAGTQQAIRRSRRTCSDVLESCLAQIDRWEQDVRAWVSIDRAGARNRASQLDADQAAGTWRGPLHGIPIGIKDLVDVAGWPTAAGAAWLAGNVATRDAPLVARLRAAGAIILGKTVTTQFACFDPPVTRNPWNLERTPGGSSSGSAAAVATGMCLGAIGSQTGGSITRPASFCGVVGCKPTYGLVPLEGVYPLAASLDHAGPIARSVEDVEILLNVIGNFPAPARPAVKSVRLGRLRGLFADRAERESLAVFETALASLARAGATIDEAPLPAEFADVLNCHRILISREVAAHHRPFLARHGEGYLPCIRGLIDEGLVIDEAEYARCLKHQRALARQMAELSAAFDALVCPATVGPAPTGETTGDPSFNAPWSYTGQPTVTIPSGFSPDRMPLGLQLVGTPRGETGLFRAAAWCEGLLAHGLAGQAEGGRVA